MDWDDVVSGAEQFIQYLRVTAHGFWLLAGIVISAGAFYVTSRLVWIVIRFLERTILEPW